MQKTILLTGATDGIGYETAKMLVSMGHHVLIHGRNSSKIETVKDTLLALKGEGTIESYIADLSHLSDVEALAKEVGNKHKKLDVLINNAGVYKTPSPITEDGLDIRFVVNTIAPYLLMTRLMPLLGNKSRVINLSSAAQSPVNFEAFKGNVKLSDSAAYSQSKLALTMWSHYLAMILKDKGPIIVAVNPGSLLASKMVKEAFGVEGSDIQIGAKILCAAALSDEFEGATGQYYDNDSGQFASPHPDALDLKMGRIMIELINELIVTSG